jgi:hypothetical protein
MITRAEIQPSRFPCRLNNVSRDEWRKDTRPVEQTVAVLHSHYVLLFISLIVRRFCCFISSHFCFTGIGFTRLARTIRVVPSHNK